MTKESRVFLNYGIEERIRERATTEAGFPIFEWIDLKTIVYAQTWMQGNWWQQGYFIEHFCTPPEKYGPTFTIGSDITYADIQSLREDGVYLAEYCDHIAKVLALAILRRLWEKEVDREV